MDPSNGTSPVSFGNLNLDQYYVSVRHRNHLGAMTGATVDFAAAPSLVDFSSPSLSVYGSNTTKLVNGLMTLWAGNAQLSNQSSGYGVINYNGSNNDRLAILNVLGGNQLATLAGYLPQDLNMNGVVTYNGSNNDRVLILNNLGGNQLGQILEQLLP